MYGSSWSLPPSCLSLHQFLLLMPTEIFFLKNLVVQIPNRENQIPNRENQLIIITSVEEEFLSQMT